MTSTTDSDVDLDLYEPVDPGGASAPLLDAEADVGEWDTPEPVARPAVPTPRAAAAGRGPNKAEVEAAYKAKSDNTRRARRRRRLAGVALTTMIFASAAASVVGWPLVLAGLAAAGGTSTVGYAAVKGAQTANGGGRNRRGPRGGGAGYGPGGGGRGRLFGGGGRGAGGGRGRLFGGAGRGGGAGTGRHRAPGGGLLGGLGRKAAAAGAGRKAAAKQTSGARSGPTAGRRTSDGRRNTNRRTPFGTGRGPAGGGRRGGAGNQGGPRNARQAKRQAVQRAKQQQAIARGQHNAAARMRPAARRLARAQQRAQQRWQRQDQARQLRDQRRDARRQARWTGHDQRRQARQARRDQRRVARRTARHARTQRSRAFYRRYFRRWAAVARRRVWWPVRNRGWARVSPLVGLGRRARMLAAFRRLNPGFGGTRQQRRFRAMFAAYLRRIGGGIGGAWRATVARLFADLNRTLRTAARARGAQLAQLWRDLYAHLAGNRRPLATPVPPAPAPAPAPARRPRRRPYRGLTPAERATLAAALGMAAAARAQAPARPAVRRPSRPAPAATAAPGRARPSTRNPRPTMAVPVRPAVRTPRGTRPMTTVAHQDAAEITHAAWEAAMSALNDNVASYEIPDDGTGVLNVDSFIASIGGFMIGLSGVLDQVSSHLSEGPTNAVVVEQLNEFSTAITAMAADAAQVYEAWTTNEDNAHDLRRAHGEVQRAELFNVGG